jgi:hypothetical protein
VDKGFPVQGPPTRPLAGIALQVSPEGQVHAVGDLPKPTETGGKEA